MSVSSDFLSFTPYPELTAEISNGQLGLSAPWVSITADIDPGAMNFATFCVEHLHDPLYLEHISRFLAPFADFPLAFVRSKKFSAALVGENVDDALSFAKCSSSDEYDALAALTCLRRTRLVSEQSKMSRAVASLQMMDLGPHLARKAVFQNFYVTSNCSRILSKATTKFESVASALSEFANEEKGHERLVQSVVEQIGSPPEGVLAETKAIVSLLEASIDSGLLAFAIGLEVFEGIEFTSKESPLARLVGDHFGERAALPLQKHYAINRKHKHGQVGVSLMNEIGKTSKSDVVNAGRINEQFAGAIDDMRAAIFLNPS